MVAPAALVEQARGHILVPAAITGGAVGNIGAPAPRAAEPHLAAHAGAAAAVQRGEGDRAAQRVEAERRVRAWHHAHRAQRELGQHVPLHDIAEGLVDAHAVEIHRQALRGPEQPRGAIAAVREVGLVQAALDIIDLHAGQPAGQQVGGVAGLRLVDGTAAHDHAAVGQQLPVHTEARKRRGADDLDLLRLTGRVGAQSPE